jgi:hypothetical protein
MATEDDDGTEEDSDREDWKGTKLWSTHDQLLRLSLRIAAHRGRQTRPLFLHVH